MPRCREHSWIYSEGYWHCKECGERAANSDPNLHPCPKCGAKPEGQLVYCKVCLDGIYGLDLQDA